MRLGSYNVKNLFLADDPGIALTEFGARPKRRAELRALARALNHVDADVVALQELGSRAALSALNNLLTQPYPFLSVVPGNSSRGIQLGFASRLPMTVHSHADQVLTSPGGDPLMDYPNAVAARQKQPSVLRLQRDLLQADIELDGVALSVFTVHLKSPNQPRWCRLSAAELRTAECRLIARLLTEFQQQQPDRAVVLLGDFNDTWPSPALAALEAAGFEFLSFSGSADTGTFWPAGLIIDHILVNAVARGHLIPDSARVHDKASFRRGSDHCIVSVDFDWSY